MEMLSQHIIKCRLILFALMIFPEVCFIDGRPMNPPIAPNANSLKENYQISSAKIISRKIDVPRKITEKGEVSSQGFGPDDLAAAGMDDFLPTKLGNSPGVGHSFPREKDGKSIETDGGDRHVVTASRNDFRPTDPGHSPGVGHSFGEKAIAEPNS
ncbi:hypothetical protein BT93_I0564 [Corymbia citriodora subsp. variegata]|nr:hypothetical protein BT93_I0564 [Corymbia citriodora subsp. variegata]